MKAIEIQNPGKDAQLILQNVPEPTGSDADARICRPESTGPSMTLV